MSGDHNQYQKPDGKCRRCGEVNPAYIHTCTPKQEPVAWMYQHEDTGLTMCVIVQQVGAGFEKNNPRWKKITPLYTAPPQREEGCAECGKQASDGWALYCVKCSEPVQEPVGWIYEDDEGRMMFSQMPHPDPLWEPVYRVKK